MDYMKNESSLSTIGVGGIPSTSSSNSVALRLYLNGQQRNSSRNSFSSEISEPVSSDSDINQTSGDISNQMSAMSKKLANLHDLYMTTREEKAKYKAESAILQERIHFLEEQAQANEQRWSEKLKEEKQKLKDLFARYEREKQLEAESGALRYQMLEKDLKNTNHDKERLAEKLKDANKNLEDLRNQNSELLLECERLEKSKRELKLEFERYRIDALTRIENNAEILEELTKQSDQLKTFPRQGSLTERIILLEDELERLRSENRDLCAENKDLQAQIIHNSVECGRNLLENGQPSLATELNGMDSQTLMNTLREQELVNQRLRNYVNGILMRIIELHPEILEIKEVENSKAKNCFTVNNTPSSLNTS